MQHFHIVGYQNLTTAQGFNFTVPTFKSIGRAIDIQDIKLDFGESSATGLDNLQVLGTGGETIVTYNWLPGDWMWPVSEKDGWSNEMGAYATRELKNGEGFIIDIVDASTTKVVCSGEVSKDKTEIGDTVQGFNWTGNIAPRTIDIQDIKLDFGEGSATGLDNLQVLGTGGETLETYNWLPGDWMWPVSKKDGWSNEMGAYATRELTAGQGFLIDIVEAGTKIILPEGYTPAN